jgi:ABC-type phosphate/phosphonate transport system substrate-binding protein
MRSLSSLKKIGFWCGLLLAGLLIAPAYSVAERPLIQFGIFERMFVGVDPGDLRVMFSNLFQNIKVKGDEYRVSIFEDEEEFIAAVKEGKLDVFPLSPKMMIDRFEDGEVNPRMGVQLGEQRFDQLIILANKKKGISRLEDLKGATLLMENSNFDSMCQEWADVQLAAKGLERSEKFFESIKLESKSSKVILPVYFGAKDACITTQRSFDMMAELNPQLKKELVTIDSSEPFITFFLGFKKGLDVDSNGMLKGLASLHQNERGKQLLLLAKVRQMIILEEGELNSAIDLYKKYKSIASMQRD